MNKADSVSGKTSKEVCELLNIKTTKLLKITKILGKKYEMGKYTYFNDSEIENIKSYLSQVDTSVKEYRNKWPNGELRYNVSAFNSFLNRRIRLPRHHYNYLVGCGDWDKGIISIPKGHVIHHIDLDYLNDDYSNLKLMTISEHRKYHDSIDSTRRNNTSLAMKAFWQEHPDFIPTLGSYKGGLV